MRALVWAARIIVFLFLCAFALKNADTVNVRFFFDSVWQAPLIIVCLAFFTAGVALGIVSPLATLFRLRRRVAQLKREAEQAAGVESRHGYGQESH